MTPVTLAISTSTQVQQVGLQLADGTLIQRSDRWKRGQPRTLLRDIEALLHQAGLAATDIERMVADTGPGSFTGLRFGLATARAIAWAHQIQVYGVGSLEAMAEHALGPDGSETASQWAIVLPARRGVVYCRAGWRDGEQTEVAWSAVLAEVGQEAGRGIIGPADLVATAADVRTRHVERPSLEAILALSDRKSGQIAAQLLPDYVALSQPERLAVGR